MYWKLTRETIDPEADLPPATGRFVLHRHTDRHGPHLDLRLEQDGHLVGWRVDAAKLDGEIWATEKMPHPTRWLDQDGDALREDAGTYAWREADDDNRWLVLSGANGPVEISAERHDLLPLSTVCALSDALHGLDLDAERAVRLLHDGRSARQRAIARLTGLARELDGDAFDADTSAKALAPLSLDEIHTQLRAYEVRFDAKYPPLPTSQPEPLTEQEAEDRSHAAMAILRD
jgi:hypothetical protein